MELFFLTDERLRALARRARGDERRLARALRRVYAHEAPPGGPDVLVMGPEDNVRSRCKRWTARLTRVVMSCRVRSGSC